MLAYCLKCKKKKCRFTHKKKLLKTSRFMKEQEAKGILSSLGLTTSLNKIPLLGKILF